MILMAGNWPRILAVLIKNVVVRDVTDRRSPIGDGHDTATSLSLDHKNRDKILPLITIFEKQLAHLVFSLTSKKYNTLGTLGRYPISYKSLPTSILSPSTTLILHIPPRNRVTSDKHKHEAVSARRARSPLPAYNCRGRVAHMKRPSRNGSTTNLPLGQCRA